ncbi:SAV_2336 N-terminal domain-related protein [Streptomyces narbonensis]|uniref:SAV_2336 N-terminal domain-related protein n=1 Tax=Streptomyces narbonensis TaxID=67333 RepID=A0ABV3CC15_9ACTN
MPGEVPDEFLRLLASGPEIGSPTVDDVADVLWLARHVTGRTRTLHEGDTAAVPSDDGTADRPAEEYSAPDADVPPAAVDAGPHRGAAEGEHGLRDDEPRGGNGPLVELFPTGTPSRLGPTSSVSDGASTGTRASAVRVPGAFALADGLALSRALRPLKREVRAPGPLVLDEAASATASAEARFPLPVRRPATEPWLSVDLVVDAGPSMVMWHNFSAELRTLLERHGAFRDVRCWSMSACDGRIDLVPFRRRGQRPGRGQGLRRSPEQLADPTGRRAVLVLTDGVGPAWHRDRIGPVLRHWARTSPVAILQVLPRRLWHRTSLRPVPVLAAAQSRTGRSVPLIHAADPMMTPLATAQPECWIPVLEVDAQWWEPWAEVVAGTSIGSTPLLAVPVAGVGAGPGVPDSPVRTVPAGPWADLDRFRAEASATAFELAGYLAAAPLTLPVMRLVQRAMLPASGPMHLAEVFLSGLLVAVDGPYAENLDPETVLYDFGPGIRDQLLDTLTRRESMQVLDVLSGVSGAVAQRFGGTLDFRALAPVGDPDSPFSIPTTALPFARVAMSVLRGLGGPNRQLASAVSTAMAARDLDSGAAPDTTATVTAVDEERVPPVAAGAEPVVAPLSTTSEQAQPLPSASLPSISKIFQPMLFVGLGGTGALVGAELERGLRRSLCGPAGTELVAGGRRLPFQLPDFLQFVYADFTESELSRLPHVNASGAEAAAYARTSRVVQDLLPDFDTSPEVTRMLRVSLHEETRSWLPRRSGEPRVAPLRSGTAQFPTIGRAALFAALRHGLEPVVAQLREAIGAIGTSAGDLAQVGGGRIRGCDVFVAFSVAGGTGAGIYHDFLHLIGHEFRRAKVPRVNIYPLVFMPSAHPPEAGGGREAELNAGPAVVDLAHLVDDQNAWSNDADARGQRGSISVRYPQDVVVSLRPSTVRTAILLSRPDGVRPDDLRRSATAMIMSLIGTESHDDLPSRSTDDDDTSFAAGFVNRNVERSTPSRSGIGRRGLSTGFTASLTVPVDDVAEIIAGRLLAEAVREMDADAQHPRVDGPEQVRELFYLSGIGRLWARDAPEVPDPQPLPRGSRAISQALRDRLGDMERELDALDRGLDREIPRMVEDFAPAIALRRLIGSLGPFRLERVTAGQAGPNRIDRVGFMGMLENRRLEPERPTGVARSAPLVPRIKGGLVPVRWGDPEVRLAIEAQNDWYAWRARLLWHQHWREHEERHRPVLRRARQDLHELVRALRVYEESEHRSFTERCRELYREDRTGLSCLLPTRDTVHALHGEVFDRLCTLEGLTQNRTPSGLLEKMLGPDEWVRALDAARRSPSAAVNEIRQVVEQRVKVLFRRSSSILDGRSLLPSMEELLQAAAGDEAAAASVDSQWLDEFRSRLAALLPAQYVPEGNGPLRVLVTHPYTESDRNVAEFLKQGLNIPRAAVEFRAADTDSITVVLLRSEMSLADVPEVRHTLRAWSEARKEARVDDYLPWRQRLGYRDDWLATTEQDRQRILHSILCAMWNGQVEVEGRGTSPHIVRIRLNHTGAATLTLRLDTPDEGGSSWTGLLRAYERWALLEEEPIVQDICEQLMAVRPRGPATTPEPERGLFRILVHEVAPQQIAWLEETSALLGPGDDEWITPLLGFWTETLNGALDLRFPGAQRATRARATLRALDGRDGSDGERTQSNW